MKRNILFSVLILFFLCIYSSGSLSVSISDQGTDVRDSGVLVESANLTIEFWDAASGGNVIYNTTFTDAIVNGSWNLNLDVSLEYGKDYYKDYKINSVDLDFDGSERLMWYSPLGDISGEDVRDDSLTGSDVNESELNCTQILGSEGVCGVDAVSPGTYAAAIGYETTASGDYSTAMGYNSTASGTYSTAMGFDTTASSYSSTALGYQTTASDMYSTALGYRTTASGMYGLASGWYSTASGYYSTALGRNTVASGYYSTAIGREIEAGGDYSMAIALNDQNGVNVTQDNTMAIMGGKVGIGVLNPTYILDVQKTGGPTLRVKAKSTGSSRVHLDRVSKSDDEAIISFMTNSGEIGTEIYAIGLDNDNTDKLHIGSNLLIDKYMTVDSEGNVGFGTTTPQQRVHISNVLMLEPTNSPGTCNANTEGSIYYDDSFNELCFCNGSNWWQVDGDGSC